MALKHYEGEGELYFNGRLLGEAHSVRWRLLSNNQKVYTFRGGMAGRSKGPRESEATIETAIPIEGYEADFYAACRDDADVTLVFIEGGKRHAVDGWIEDVESGRAVNQTASKTANFMGGKPRSL